MDPATDNGLQSKSEPSRSNLRRALIYLPPIVLTIIATTQLFLSKQSTLVPWKGGGFGMFSSIDIEGYRIARAYLTLENRQEYPVQLASSDEFELSVPRATAFPTEPRLNALADQILRMNWRLNAGERVVSPSPRGSQEPKLRGAAIRLEILRITYERESRRIRRVLLAEVIRERP
jgi:hypothetical protein